MFSYDHGNRGTAFERTYRCYPAAFIDKVCILSYPQLESGDKIIMPPSALGRLASLHINYPMLFELRNDAADRVSHCGVLEFISEEGVIYMPYWMMQNLLLQEGDMVKVKNAALPKGTYVKLQPHTQDFFDIANPKAMLETTLRNFTCLTTGDSFMVAYNNQKYYIDVIETKPANAITITDTDCEVDLAPSLDYIKSALKKAKEAQAEKGPKFNPFSGSGKRLDGKPLKYQSPSNGNSLSSAAPGSHRNSRQSKGNIVFGSDVYRTTEIGEGRNQIDDLLNKKSQNFGLLWGRSTL
ncbi:ubiquitin fusion degradation protein 1 homolog isoform X2 [Neltuma alba]|uniref:ubiquitin fusion degradation protein 1 homolog isoform X2 n=1 Tax=Neltuma alba TaxID=207710 RepID=UPI0010A3054E|nr:ubiquitin fusion degradation protein 1 homolog isoform X2 [Prosopis alba]